MNSEKGRDFAGYIAHIPHVIALAYLGLFLILLLGPVIAFLLSDSGSKLGIFAFGQLIQRFFGFWTRMLEDLTATRLVALLIVSYPLGVVFSECGYRLGCWLRYHGNLNWDEGFTTAHFKLRCKILENPIEQRLWEWQLFQFNFCYYTELLMIALTFLLSIALLAPVPAALAHPSGLPGNAAPIAGLAGLLGLSCLGWVLMRKARNEKLKDFRRVNEAVESLLSTK